ncbi:hypothetical protein BD413DRAFT_552703 [Trametes elegans]|nr:hypothetical protein BD413DRAFT_552703 [Trametes elegans]
MSLHAEVPHSNGYQLLWHYGCRWSMENALILARNVKAKGIVARPPIPDVNIDADIDTDKLYGNEEVNTELERLSALFSWGLHFLEGTT